MLWRMVRRRGRARPQIRRFIVVGLDGQDPRITDRLMAEGKLPNFARLAAAGSYSRLRTVFPSLSPVAWSSFSTGTNPGMHNIFDFVERDRKSYLPKQASVEIGKLERTMKLGRWRIPLERPALRLLRKSKPFWTLLGEHDIWSTVLRVPITFPPDRFYGAQLSAMMVPDLLGALGTFLHYTTRPGSAAVASSMPTSTCWPRPVRSRARRASVMPCAANMPLTMSAIATPRRNGGPSAAPVMLMSPPSAWMTAS